METTPEDKKKAAKRAYDRARYQKNSEYIKIKVKKYQEKNLEMVKIRNKRYKTKYSEHIKHRMKEYYIENAESIKHRSKVYYSENSASVRRRIAKTHRNRKLNDPIYKMVCNLRSRIQHVLKFQGASKDMKTKELFGASQEEVWTHLESQFRGGMTRNNNTSKGWHIDHIKPMSSFDLSDLEQLKECCHYTNLQPLWWWENLKKRDTVYKS